MFRRKTRNEPAYTGVSSIPPHGAQPNSNALAAALTIGRGLKSPSSQSKGTSGTVAPGASKPATYTTSTYSSNSSITRPPSQAKLSGGQKANSMLSSSTLLNRRRSIKIDQSHFDQFDSEGASTANYKNNPDPMSLSAIGPPKQKMIKRYIPTSTGVKVIEVPEESINQQISRSNSLRAGSNIRANSLTRFPRTSSINSMSTGPRTNSISTGARTNSIKTGQRTNSLQKSQLNRPNQTRNASGSQKSLAPMENELDTLQSEINKQKQLQKQIELKKLEYQQLKSQNDKSLRQLSSNHDVLDSTIEEDDEIDNLEAPPVLENLTSSAKTVENSNIERCFNDSHFDDSIHVDVPELNDTTIISDTSDIHESSFIHDTSSQKLSIEDQIAKVPVPELQAISSVDDNSNISQTNDLLTNKQFASDKIPFLDNNTQTSGSTLVPSVLVHRSNSISSFYDDAPEQPGIEGNNVVNNNSGAEIGIINQYISSQEQLDETVHPGEETEERSNFAQTLRPKYDDASNIEQNVTSAPEVQRGREIEHHYEQHENRDLLSAPVLPGNASSVSSIRSTGSSESPKKPLKSAMKNSGSIANMNSINSPNYNPAREAYISLTTSENTRLNSKLSTSNLNEPYLNPTPANQRRMSQTLRQNSKSPLRNSQGPTMTKTLRPQSLQVEAAEKKSMSNRSLRSSVIVAPISAHPALQPGYKSPSKLKAQELYAKANSRPKSQFNQIARRSSFTKSEDTSGQPQSQNQTNYQIHQNHGFSNGLQLQNEVHKQHTMNGKLPMLTLRDSRPQSIHTPLNQGNMKIQGEKVIQLSNSGFKSRFNDSDEEDNFVAPRVQQVSAPPNTNSFLRSPDAPVSKTTTEAPKEKKKFGKLRKLFGKSR